MPSYKGVLKREWCSILSLETLLWMPLWPSLHMMDYQSKLHYLTIWCHYRPNSRNNRGQGKLATRYDVIPCLLWTSFPDGSFMNDFFYFDSWTQLCMRGVPLRESICTSSLCVSGGFSWWDSCMFRSFPFLQWKNRTCRFSSSFDDGHASRPYIHPILVMSYPGQTRTIMHPPLCGSRDIRPLRLPHMELSWDDKTNHTYFVTKELKSF